MKSVLAAALILSSAAVANAQPAQIADAVLAANHAAVGDVPTSGRAEFHYAHTASSLTGTYDQMFDLATGAFVEAEAAGAIGDATGYDGTTPWQRDISGANTAQQGGDRIATAVNEAYRLANLWWRPDHGDATLTYAGRETIDGKVFDHLTVTPKGGKPFDAWFDVDTHMLGRIAEDRQFFHTETRYADYRLEGGLMLAHKITGDAGVGPGGYDVSILNQATIGTAQPLSAYARPTAPPTGASIADGAASTTVPFRLLNNHVYVAATVNSKGPYTFIVDTGGHTLLSPRLIAEVGLNPVGQAVSSGAGEGHATTGFVHFDEIAIGGVRLRDQIGFATDVYDKSIEGIPVDGMVGFELIRRMVTQIDYGRRTITFTDPARFKPRDASVSVPFVFYDHVPDVAGDVLGMPAHFDIDTGSRSEIDLTSPFVGAHQLRSRFTKGTSAVTGWGVGGPARSYMVRLPSLHLGAVEVDNIPAGLSQAKGGSFSDPNYDGNIGSALLKRFVVTFDYAHQRLYLKPVTPPPADAGAFDRSGLWINAVAKGYEVTDVAAGSAAAEAGVGVGDVITAIDGRPVLAEALADARLKLCDSPPGTQVKLTVTHGAETRTVTLILRDQI